MFAHRLQSRDPMSPIRKLNLTYAIAGSVLVTSVMGLIFLRFWPNSAPFLYASAAVSGICCIWAAIQRGRRWKEEAAGDAFALALHGKWKDDASSDPIDLDIDD